MVAKSIAKKMLFIHKPTDYKCVTIKRHKLVKAQPFYIQPVDFPQLT